MNPINQVKNVFKGSVKIPFTNQRMPKAVIYPAVAGGILLSGYVLIQNNIIPIPPELRALFDQIFGAARGGPNATTAIFESAEAVKPRVAVPVKGTFVNEAQVPRAVPQAYWYVKDHVGNVRLNGIIGQDVTEFSFNIPTDSLETEKDYTIYLSDAPANATQANLVITV